MCDEYDDERMRAFWRLLAEKEGLLVLPTADESASAPDLTTVAIGPDAQPPRKARSLTR